MRSVVVLPQPEGPSSVMKAPSDTAREVLSTARGRPQALGALEETDGGLVGHQVAPIGRRPTRRTSRAAPTPNSVIASSAVVSAAAAPPNPPPTLARNSSVGDK